MKFVKRYRGWRMSCEELQHKGRTIMRYEAKKKGDVIANGLSIPHLEMLIRGNDYNKSLPRCYQ